MYQVQQSPDGGNTYFVQRRWNHRLNKWSDHYDTFAEAELAISDISMCAPTKCGWTLRIMRCEFMKERPLESDAATTYREFETLDICAADGFLSFEDAANFAVINRLENFGVIMNGPKCHVPTESRNYRVCFPLRAPMTYFSDPR